MINPMQRMQAMQQNADPRQMIMQMAKKNPAIQRAMQMINGRTPEQIYDMAQQMANRYGQNLQQLAQQLNVRLPR